MDIHDLRREYTQRGIARQDLADNPLVQFEQWFSQAKKAEILEPNAMSLATADASGEPAVRTVLLKAFDASGFTFYTNYGSLKARHLTENARAALLFSWLALERQVQVVGTVEKVSLAESLRYFVTRPHGSQIGAWVSQQSSIIASRSVLLAEFEKMKAKFDKGEVPLPDGWGGYRVVPKRIEFWQGRPSRLHDRFLYTKIEKGTWKIDRLAP